MTKDEFERLFYKLAEQHVSASVGRSYTDEAEANIEGVSDLVDALELRLTLNVE